MSGEIPKNPDKMPEKTHGGIPKEVLKKTSRKLMKESSKRYQKSPLYEFLRKLLK